MKTLTILAVLLLTASGTMAEDDHPDDIYGTKSEEHHDVTVHVGGPRVSSDDGKQYVYDRLQRQLDRDEQWRQERLENTYREIEMLNRIRRGE